eukprot:scaffold70402_cov67-Phaeocystis_antarctica.AAC.1
MKLPSSRPASDLMQLRVAPLSKSMALLGMPEEVLNMTVRVILRDTFIGAASLRVFMLAESERRGMLIGEPFTYPAKRQILISTDNYAGLGLPGVNPFHDRGNPFACGGYGPICIGSESFSSAQCASLIGIGLGTQRSVLLESLGDRLSDELRASLAIVVFRTF